METIMRSAYIKHERVQVFPIGKSRTKQSMREESDINIIMARYEKTGLIEHVNKYGGQYADMPDDVEFHSAMNLVTEAQQTFADLPAGMRDRFRNDPEEFLEFLSNPENRDEMVELGFLPPPAPEPVVEEKPLDPGAPAPASPASPPEGEPAAS